MAASTTLSDEGQPVHITALDIPVMSENFWASHIFGFYRVSPNSRLRVVSLFVSLLLSFQILQGVEVNEAAYLSDSAPIFSLVNNRKVRINCQGECAENCSLAHSIVEFAGEVIIVMVSNEIL